MSSSSSQVDTTVRLSFALVNGLGIAMVLPILYMLYPFYAEQNFTMILFVLIPILSYFLSVFLNGLTQYIACGSTSMSHIFLASMPNPLFVVLFVFFSWMFPFFRSFVFSVLPESSDETMKEALSYSFYLLWGGLYGQVYSGGFAQACPVPASAGKSVPK
jgi:hypothetical protein